MKTANFNKDPNGLLPAIVQDVQTLKVLMLGYMNEEALEAEAFVIEEIVENEIVKQVYLGDIF